MKRRKREAKLIASILFVLIFASTASAALEGYVVSAGPTEVQDLIYTWGSSDTTPYYQDAQSYADVGFMVCETDGGAPSDKYVGLQYLMNQNGETTRNQLISYGNQNLALADQSVTYNGMNCKRTSIGPSTVSPSVISGTPTTKIAAFPADLYMLVSDNQDGSNPQFIQTSSQLSGSYNGDVSYNYGTNEITLGMGAGSITVDSNIGTRSFAPSTTGRGVSTDRPMIVGVCSDRNGNTCETGTVKLQSNSFPRTFVFDVLKSNVNDQNTYTRYGVANGKLIDTVRIGADLRVSDVSVSKNPIYYSQQQEISFEITNRGNVPVTSTFNVEVTIEGPEGTVKTQSFSVSGGLQENGGSVSESFTWDAYAKSGNYNVRVNVDTENDIVELNENPNSGITSFELKPITLPEIYVNGEKIEKTETAFPSPGVPYNFSVKIKNSDNETLANSTVEVIETDGMTSFSPTQRLDNSTVTESINKVRFDTNSQGKASITLIPSGNVLLSDKYSNLEIQDQIDYSIRLTGNQADGTDFKFINDGQLQNYYPLNVSEPGNYDGEAAASQLPNLEEYVKLGMDGVYTIFIQFWGAVT